MPVGDARDLRKVRDRDDLRALSKPSQGLGDGVGRLAADPRVDLVEDERHLPARRRGKREGDPAELSAGGGLRNRRKGESRIGADQEGDGVSAAGTGLPLRHLGVELALAHADPAQLGCDRLREALDRAGPGFVEVGRERLDARLRLRERSCCIGGRIGSCLSRVELRARRLCPLQKFLVRPAGEAALGVGDALELALNMLQAPRLGLQGVEKRPEVCGRVADSYVEVAQLARRGGELRSQPLERCDRLLRLGGEHRSAVSVIW